MEEKNVLSHNAYYFIELLILLLGFFLIINFAFDISVQFMILVFLLLSYVTMGVIHHRVHHTFSTRIMVEYVLISSLILAGFLFLNISRI